MNKRRSRSDDVLFISALAAILFGVAILLYTTRTIVGAPLTWPILVMAAGGVLFFFSLVRRTSFHFFFSGLLFLLEGAFFLASMLLGWRIAKFWPLGMAIAGITGFVSGLAAKRKFKAFYAVPSIGFTLLGLAFAVFSFGLVKGNFSSFIAVWWPTLLIAGGISLFVVYGLTRHASARRAEGPEGRVRTHSGKTVDRSKRDRDPTSGP
ncbi:MAG: hypothetical protein ABSF43_15240 [Rectinemataceae bacterium]|jgi:hypothetical protein